MKTNHLTTIVPSLVSLLIPTTAMSAPAVKAVEVNGVRLSYMEQGSGEPAVFVHGAPSDLRTLGPSDLPWYTANRRDALLISIVAT